MTFKYSVVCDTLKWIGYDFLKRPHDILEVIKDSGYDGADLPADPERMNGKELRQIIDSVGLKVPEVLGAWAYFHAGENRDLCGQDEEARRRGIQYSKKSIELAVMLGAQFFEICAPQPPIAQLPFPELPIKTLRKNFMEAVKEICRYADDRGITILLEPLNHYEAYVGVLNSVYHAINLINELGFSNIGIQPDIFHMNIEDISITESLQAAGKLVKHVHLNETNHCSLGTGHADYRAILRVLKKINFTGYLAIYMPLTTQETLLLHKENVTIKPDLKNHLEKELKYMKEMENTVDLQRRIYEMDAPYSSNR